jgi:hypothetical protein
LSFDLSRLKSALPTAGGAPIFNRLKAHPLACGRAFGCGLHIRERAIVV